MLLAVLLPAGVVASAAANGDGGVGASAVTCDSFSGDLTTTPGIRNIPSSQTVHATGRLLGCIESGGFADVSATLQMPHGSCAFLAMSGNAKFSWANGKITYTTLTLDPRRGEPGKFLVGGRVGNGLYHGLFVFSGVRIAPVGSQSGACTAANPVTHLRFTSINSLQLLPPNPRNTTSTRPHTSTSLHSTSTFPTVTTGGGGSSSSSTTVTTDPNNTVPVTNLGSTSPGAVLVASTDPSGGSGTGAAANGTSVLAFTGSNRFGALLGLESLIVGGALACLGRDRRNRRAGRSRRHGVRSWLRVTLPPAE
jgi:hypothetical protein